MKFDNVRDIDLVKIMPHKAPMLLIERVLKNTPEELIAGVTIHQGSFGLENSAVPSWFGIEYMAQSIAAYNGLNSPSTGKPEIGFLVGVRNYLVKVQEFALESELEIHIYPNFIVENSGSFDCKIKLAGQEIAEALITTYKPDASFIEKLKGGQHE
jgi:predicted hotdog family 3-hydroxylacyl-ACP dehydratase